MKMTTCEEPRFKQDFMPLIIDLWCGDKYKPDNNQHVEWIQRRIHVRFEDFSTALCAYTDEGKPIGYIWYKHDTGMEGVSFSGKDAHIIQIGLYEEYQRQGFGTQLLNEVCKRILQDGGECLYTDTYAKSSDAMQFYIKNNFIPVALHPGEDGIHDFGQVYMVKFLKEVYPE